MISKHEYNNKVIDITQYRAQYIEHTKISKAGVKNNIEVSEGNANSSQQYLISAVGNVK